MTEGWCPMCGPTDDYDEDGCCNTCGSTANGDGADCALACVSELAAVRAELAAIKARRCGTCMHWRQVIGPPGEQDECRLRKHVGPRRQDWHCADWPPKGGE
jgi:hypothetical protein